MSDGTLELVGINDPDALVVTVAEAIAACRIGGDPSESVVESLIRSATAKVERDTGRQLMPAIWYQYLDKFPCGRDPIVIDKLPIITDDNFGISYAAVDDDDVQSSFTDVIWHTAFDNPVKVYPAPGVYWPTTLSGFPNAVIVQFQAGYADAASVPADLKNAIKLLVGQGYESPDGMGFTGLAEEVQKRYESLILTYRLMRYV